MKLKSIPKLAICLLLFVISPAKAEISYGDFLSNDEFFVLVKRLPVEPEEAFVRNRPWSYGFQLYNIKNEYVLLGKQANYETSTADRFRFRFDFDTGKIQRLENNVELDKLLVSSKTKELNADESSDDKLQSAIKAILTKSKGGFKKIAPLQKVGIKYTFNFDRCKPHKWVTSSNRIRMTRAMSVPYLWSKTGNNCQNTPNKKNALYSDTVIPNVWEFEKLIVFGDPNNPVLFATHIENKDRSFCASINIYNNDKKAHSARYFLNTKIDALAKQHQDDLTGKVIADKLFLTKGCKEINLNLYTHKRYEFFKR